MAGDGCHMGGLVAGEVLLSHLKVLGFWVQCRTEGAPGWIPHNFLLGRMSIEGLAGSSLCLPTSCLCSVGLYLRDGVGGTGSQATHVLPTLNEKVPGQRERIKA